MKVELKNCPCCGGTAHYTEADKSIRMPDFVQCLTCFLQVEGGYEKSSALDAWNNRVSQKAAEQ